MPDSDDQPTFKKRLSKEQRERAASLYAQGGNADRVGAEVGMSHLSVIRVVREAGGDIRKPPGGRGGMKSNISPEQSEEAVRLYLEGKSADGVGTELGISAGTVLKILRQAKVEIKKPGGKGSNTR